MSTFTPNEPAHTRHAVVIAGAGPTGLMLAGELALAGVDVAIVERRASQQVDGSRAGGLHARTIEVLDQRGILNTGVQDAVNLGWKLAQVVNGPSPDGLLDTYHAERNPVGARVQRDSLVQNALRGTDERAEALRDTMTELLSMDEPRKRFAGIVSGLGIHYDLGDGHPLLGRRMPDLDLVTADGTLRVFTLLHEARPVLLNLGEPGGLDITPWADHVRLIDAKYAGPWELPVLGAVTAPTAVLIRPRRIRRLGGTPHPGWAP